MSDPGSFGEFQIIQKFLYEAESGPEPPTALSAALSGKRKGGGTASNYAVCSPQAPESNAIKAGWREGRRTAGRPARRSAVSKSSFASVYRKNSSESGRSEAPRRFPTKLKRNERS